METDLFQSCGHCLVLQVCWHIECSTFTASSFRVWNSTAGIPLSSLALFTVMLPKAHLTSYSRMSGSRWVSTAPWLSGWWRSSVYSCHLFLVYSASFRAWPFLFTTGPTLARNVPSVQFSSVPQSCSTLCNHMNRGTNSRSSPKLMCIESVMPSSHLILCRPLLLLPPIPPSIRVFSNQSALRIRWPKY